MLRQLWQICMRKPADLPYFTQLFDILTKPGYLEDLFILPQYRRRGIGKAMLTYFTQIVLQRDAGRLEWSVLDWNEQIS